MEDHGMRLLGQPKGRGREFQKETRSKGRQNQQNVRNPAQRCKFFIQELFLVVWGTIWDADPILLSLQVPYSLHCPYGPYMTHSKLSFVFWFWTTPSNVQSLLCSGIISGQGWGTIWMPEIDFCLVLGHTQ